MALPDISLAQFNKIATGTYNADYRPSVDAPMEFTESPGGDGPGLMSV